MSEAHFSARSRQSATPIESWNAPVNSNIQISATRPITQHGVEGMPLPPSSHIQKRTYYDKRYYTTMVQSHMNKIREEIASLSSRAAKYKPTSGSLHDDRRTAKEGARIYANYQQQLSVLNIALEMHLSRINNDQAVSETAAINMKNSSMIEELDMLFMQKTRCEESKNEVEEEIKQEDLRMQKMIEKLPPEQVQEYSSYANKNQSILNQIAKTQAEIKEIRDSVEKLKETIAFDNIKQDYLKLLKKLNSSNEHKKTLQSHLTDVPVEKERETLLKQVKDDKADSEVLQKLKTNLEEQLQHKSEQLTGLEEELDSKNSTRLKKYKDVHVRHAQVNNYIEMFDEVVSNVRGNLNDKEKQLVVALDHLLETTANDSIEEIDDLQSKIMPENVTEEFKMLTSRIARLKDTAKKLEGEEKRLKEKRDAMQEEMVMFKDIDGKRQQCTQESKEADEKQKSLRSVLSATTAAVQDAKTRLSKFESILEKNDHYREFVLTGKQLEQTELANERMEEEIKSRTTSEECVRLTEEVEILAKQRNDVLIQMLRSKNKG